MVEVNKQVNTKNVKPSRRWHLDVKKLVRDFDFDRDQTYRNHEGHQPGTVHGQKPAENCQFCGQPIMYVAVIAGRSKFAPETTKHPKYYQIGFDCLRIVLGENWKDYAWMHREYKAMVDEAAVESRKKRYAVDYAQYIAWIKTLPASLYENRAYNYQNWKIKRFLETLTTGCRNFTKQDEADLLRFMKDKRFDSTQMVETKKLQTVEIDKVKQLLVRIQEKDKFTSKTYEFVNSVLSYIIRWNGATQKQLEALNKIHKQYNTPAVATPTPVATTMDIPF